MGKCLILYAQLAKESDKRFFFSYSIPHLTAVVTGHSYSTDDIT